MTPPPSALKERSSRASARSPPAAEKSPRSPRRGSSIAVTAPLCSLYCSCHCGVGFLTICILQINMKGLDGIQGHIYVGTGCVFRRQALYGYDAPKTKKPPSRTCNCWPKWCFSCCCSNRNKKKTKSKPEKKKRLFFKRAENQSPAYALGEIEEGIPGAENDKAGIVNQQKLEKKFGQSSVFVASTLLENGGTLKSASPASLLKEAIHAISCGYEDKTDWGKEIGWIYGSITEDILTGFKMHCHGWRSIYCIPNRPAFEGSAPLNLSDRLHQVLRWALGSVEIFFSNHCPLCLTMSPVSGSCHFSSVFLPQASLK